MKKLFAFILVIVFPSSMSAIGGLGIQVGQGMVTIGATESIRNLVDTEYLVVDAIMTTTEFSNPYVIGGHFYIDAIPFVDLDADINLVGQTYEFGFNNPTEIGPYAFGWGSLSAYLTIRKTAFKLGIPILAKAKLFYGGGYNQHNVTPLMTIDLMEDMMGGDLAADPTNISEKDLIELLDENKIESSGIHVQAGLQFKVLLLDSFLFYRHTFAKDLVPDADAFGSLHLRLGIGF